MYMRECVDAEDIRQYNKIVMGRESQKCGGKRALIQRIII